MSETNLKERLVQCRKDKAAIEKQEKELLERIEAAKVPKLRHGDYGYYRGYKHDPVIIEKFGGDLYVTNKHGRCTFELDATDKQRFVKVGNVFDLLR